MGLVEMASTNNELRAAKDQEVLLLGLHWCIIEQHSSFLRSSREMQLHAAMPVSSPYSPAVIKDAS